MANMQSSLFLALIIAISNLPFLLFYKKIIALVNIVDRPDKIRKFHTNDVPLIGGFIVLYNLLLVFFIHIIPINFEFIEYRYFPTNRSFVSFFLVSMFLFIIGIYDDKYKLPPNTKLFILGFVIWCAVLIDPDILLTDLRFSFTSKIILLKNFSTFFTVLCFLLFINAFNMFDGINLQAGLYALIIFVTFILNGFMPIVCVVFAISIFFFLILNFQNKAFLGDNGAFLLSYIISYLFIKSYNFDRLFYADEVFLIMLVPGLELIRLAVLRLLKRQHPFAGDRLHLHHLMSDIYGYKKALVYIFLIISLPILLDYFFISTFAAIIISIIVYFSFLLFLKRQLKSEIS